eukprot:348185_1
MALQLHETNIQLHRKIDWTFSESETRVILRSSGISWALEQYYPELNKLAKYNAAGTIKLLIASGALCGEYTKSMFEIKSGNLRGSGTSAWAEYESIVLQWFKEHINDSDELEPARRYLRDLICADWVKQCDNFWPDVGEYSDTFKCSLDEEGKIPTNNYIYLWSVLGTIKMRDYRAGSSKFMAEIWANPKVELKCLKCDRYELKKWNNQCIKNMNYAKRMADGASNDSVEIIDSKLKALGW